MRLSCIASRALHAPTCLPWVAPRVHTLGRGRGPANGKRSQVLGTTQAVMVSRARRSGGRPGPLARHLHDLEHIYAYSASWGAGTGPESPPAHGLATGYTTGCLRGSGDDFETRTRCGHEPDQRSNKRCPAGNGSVSVPCLDGRCRRKARGRWHRSGGSALLAKCTRDHQWPPRRCSLRWQTHTLNLRSTSSDGWRFTTRSTVGAACEAVPSSSV